MGIGLMRRRDAASRPSAGLAAGVVAILGVAAALAASVWQHQRNDDAAALALERQADSTVLQIKARFKRYDAGLRGLRGAVMASGARAVKLQQIRTYIDSRDVVGEFPGARGFGVIWRVPRGQEAALIAEARADGRHGFTLREIHPHEGERRVISFIEPLERNRPALGLDIASEESRNQAAVAAMRSGKASLTTPITLVQATGKPLQGLLLMLPIYRENVANGTPEAREAATLGWTYAPLVVDDVLAGLEQVGRQFTLRLGAESAADSRGPLQFYGEPPPATAANDGMPEVHRSFEVQGQQWEAHLHGTPAFVASLNLTDPYRLALSIGLISLLLAATTYMAMIGRARSVRERLEVARRAAIVEGSDDAIIGATLAGVITEWNGGAERLFGYMADEALGRTVDELLLPDDRLAEDERFRATIADGQRVAPFDTLRRHRDGSLIAVALTAGPILDAQGRCVGMAKTVRDMRQAQRARAALAELNASLEEQVASRTAELVSALRDNTALLQTLDQFAIVATTDSQGTLRQVNASFCRVSGYSADELLGQDHRMLASGELARHLWRAMWARLVQGLPWRGEICNNAKEGTPYWLDCIVVPFYGADGNIERFISISTDITPLKHLQHEADQARQAAEEASRFLQEVTDRLPLRISYMDLDYRFRFVNAAQCEAYDLTRDELIGALPRMFEHGRPPADLADAFAAALRGETQSFETSVMAKGGVLVDYEARLVPDLREDGQVHGYYAVSTDISVRKRAELQLQRTLSTLSAVLDSATQVSIIAVDMDGRINLFNQGAEKLTGHQARDVMGAMPSELLHDPAEVAERCEELAAAWGESVSRSSAFTDPRVTGVARDWHYVCKDGSRVPVSLAVTPIQDISNGTVGYLGIAYDISARQQFEQSLREAMHQANEANRAKSLFLANMSHEIRTPMNAVIGLSYLLERTRLDAEQANFVTKIKLASKSLLGIINDVLDLSKIEAAEMHLERAPFSLAALLDELGPMMAVQAEAKGIALTVERPADLVDGLDGDATRLRQVLTNLLSNAIKFTTQGQVRLVVTQHACQDGEAVPLHFAVQDTGIGIPAAALDRIFQPFAQADDSTTRRYGGTGLGLSIVRQLVALMDGRVEVSSEPGVGSDFSVHLALPRAAAWVQPATPAQRPMNELNLAGLRLLVVDDSDLNLEVAKRILELQGAIVTLAGDGQQALDRLIDDPQGYDLVLMDMQMPVLDGHDATRRIRTALGLTKLPIIALTAGVTVAEQQRAAAAGMNEMLGKPFEPDGLVACILRHVSPRSRQALRARPGPASAPAAPWPALEGINMADAQRRLGNDLALMRSLL